ncbi:hypothetical protein ACODUL_05690 [Stenotrophomonas maltophilia]
MLHARGIEQLAEGILRDGGGTWHQFASHHAAHPALFALSCHSNERAGAMSESTRAQVQANRACWPMRCPPATTRT